MVSVLSKAGGDWLVSEKLSKLKSINSEYLLGYPLDLTLYLTVSNKNAITIESIDSICNK